MKSVEKMNGVFFLRPLALAAVLLLAGLAVSGCMSFDQHRLPPVVVPPRAAAGTAPSVNVQLVYQATVNGESVKKQCPQVNWEKVRQKVEKKLQARCAKRMTASGQFSRVEIGTKDSADISVNICVDNAGEGNQALAVLSGLTLCVIPCCAKDTWKITADVKNNVTGKTAVIQLEDGVTTWIELLLIVGMPFKFPTCTITHVQERLFDHIIANMQAAGCLDMTVPAAKPK